MKTLIVLLIVSFSYVASASHIMGGYVAAKRITGRQYKITTVLLSDANSIGSAHTGSIELSFGDGKTETINRTSVTTEDGIQRNTYITEHQYSSDGVYTIVFTDPNYPANILNLNGGFSDNIPFKTTCLLKVNSALSAAESADPLAFDFFKGLLNQTTHYNPTFVTGNNVNVTYELAGSAESLKNYTLPEGASINPYSGMITFTPAIPGLFLFVIRVTSFLNGQAIAQLEVPQLCRVLDGHTPSLTVAAPDAAMSSQGWYSRELAPNQTVDQQLYFTVPEGAAEFSGEVYTSLSDLGATITSIEPTFNSLAFNIKWTADPTYEKNTPYFITFRYRSSHLNITDDYNIAFYHGAPLNTGMKDQKTSEQKIVVYPNPVDGAECYITFEQNQHGELSVYNLPGKKIVTETVTGKSHVLKTGDWKPGMYIYSFVSTGGVKIQGKLEVR